MRIHFIGIGGIGVSALAQYYLTKGDLVSGSDLVFSEIVSILKKKGAEIVIGRNQQNPQARLEKLIKQADLVVYSLAIPKDHPELKIARKFKIKCQTYPEALGELTKKYFTIAVCGTHGKSTTTAMVALVLTKAGLDPTVILGTKLKEFNNSNFRIGQSKYLVIEADEWRSAFLNYWPKIIILTNIEKEHLDYYKNLRHILKTYREFISHLPDDGILIKNSECPIKSSRWKFKIENFSLKQKEAKKIKKILKIPGEHNVLNALAVLKCARFLKIPDKISFEALSKYQGAWRRFEIIKTVKFLKSPKLKGITVISDYAHHPTEVDVTLKSAREKFPYRKIWCVFQPHQYQRTFYLFKDFVKVFKKVPIDKLIITDIFDVPGRENKIIKKKVNSKKLVEAVNKSSVIYLPKEKIKEYLKKNLKGREVLIIMGAGDIYKLTQQ